MTVLRRTKLRSIGALVVVALFVVPAYSATHSASVVRARSRIFPGLPDLAGAWNGMCAASDGRIYVGICGSGKPAHLLRYDPATDQIEDLADMQLAVGEKGFTQTQDKIHTVMYEGSDGCIYGATHRSDTAQGEAARREYPGGHWFRFDPEKRKVEDLGCGMRHEGIITFSMREPHLYGLTCPSAHLLKYDLRTRTTDDLGKVNPYHVCRTMVNDSRGNLYFTDSKGKILRYSPQDNKVEPLLAELPKVDGNAVHWRTIIQGPVHDVFYGVSTVGGLLFRLDVRRPEAPKIETLVKILPHGGYPCFGLTLGKDGHLYYPVWGPRAEKRQFIHIARYDIAGAKLTDLGEVRVEEGRRLASCGAAVTGKDGTLYMLANVTRPNGEPQKSEEHKAPEPHHLRLIICEPMTEVR